MIKELELFLNALEKVTGKLHIQHLKIEPMTKPAYKKYTLALYCMIEGVVTPVEEVSKIYMVTTDEEKTKASYDIAELLITNVLKKYEIV